MYRDEEQRHFYPDTSRECGADGCSEVYDIEQHPYGGGLSTLCPKCAEDCVESMNWVEDEYRVTLEVKANRGEI